MKKILEKGRAKDVNISLTLSSFTSVVSLIFISFVTSNDFPIPLLFFVPILVWFSCWDIVSRIGIANGIVSRYAAALRRRSIWSTGKIMDQAKKLREIEAKAYGDTIIAGAGATVINRSVLINSLNAVKEDDPELADAITTVAGFIAKSGNNDAADIFKDLVSAIGDKPRRPTLIKASWNLLVNTLPDVAKLSTAVAAITGLFIK